MFIIGQKIVCIDSKFPLDVSLVCKALPLEGRVYTVRAVFVGRGKLYCKTDGETDGEVGVLLVELVNPPDPKNKHGQEIGFNAERFKPLEAREQQAAVFRMNTATF